jgi:hypothetical protein
MGEANLIARVAFDESLTIDRPMTLMASVRTEE